MKIAKIALLSVALLAPACGEGSEWTEPDENVEKQTKTIIATDHARRNTVELEVSSEDARVLAAYGPGSFVIETFSAADAEREATGAVAESGKAIAEGVNDMLSIKVLREELIAGVSGYRLVDTVQPSYRAPFVVVYRYTSQDCAMVTRVSTFNNVYASMESQQVANGAWSTIAYRTDLQKNQPLDVCDSGSYQIKARIERRNSNDYEFSGHN
jgi:hypothetical protein